MSEREPITAELRELMGGVEPRVDEDGVVTAKYVTPEAWGEFAHRCDAIDAVHAGLERENEELRERVAALDNERGNMHDGWIRMPLDADGVPICVGDEVVEVDEPDVPRTVTSVTFAGDGWWVYINGVGRRSDKYRHHHAPTVEDVLREMADRCYADEDEPRDRDAIVAEYAAKLCLAGDAS